MADETTVDVETLAQKVAKLLGKARRDGDASDDVSDLDLEGGGRVPMHRVSALSAKNRALLTQIEELQGQVEQLSGAYTARLSEVEQGFQAKLSEMQKQAAEQVKIIGVTHQEDLALVDAGLRDPLGRKALRDAWESAPKDARGESPLEWWQQSLSALEAHRADPEQAAAPQIPGTLSGYLPPPPDTKGSPRGRGAPPNLERKVVAGTPSIADLDHKSFDDFGDYLAKLSELSPSG